MVVAIRLCLAPSVHYSVSVADLHLAVAHAPQSAGALVAGPWCLMPGRCGRQGLHVGGRRQRQMCITDRSTQSVLASFEGDAAVLYFPAPQAIHSVSVAALYLPFAHATQAADAFSPVPLWLMPAPHVMQ